MAWVRARVAEDAPARDLTGARKATWVRATGAVETRSPGVELAHQGEDEFPLPGLTLLRPATDPNWVPWSYRIHRWNTVEARHR